MEQILTLVACGVMNILCFYIGAKVGQTVVKGETIETPTVNPLKVAQENRDRKEAEIEQNRLDTIMQNIENYDGTGRGQQDVPRG
jgi:hypothetical protein